STALDQMYVCCVLNNSVSFGESIKTPVSLIDTPRASPLSNSVRPLVSQRAGCPARTPMKAASMSRMMVMTGMLPGFLVIIVWSVSYVLGVERASGGNFIGTADDGACILKTCEFEWTSLEA